VSPRDEWERLVGAVQFLTRLPTPRLHNYASDAVGRSARYFPIAGQLVGLISGLVFLLASRVWSGWLAALLAVSAGILATGGLHEDGLADTADGLGGGRTPERRLTIMKDSAIGVFGVLTLGLTLAAKIGALAALAPWQAAGALILAHGLARAACVVVMAALPYAGAVGAAKEGRPVRPAWGVVAIAVLLAAWPLAFAPSWTIGLAAGAVAAAVPALAARRLIGGRTGDILGAVEQMFELGFLLGVAAVAAS
jgi:adenosylcobinamide-GDP ribazoletransferase